MTFEIVKSRDFFDLLYSDAEFCSGVGKVMLAASVLEARLRDYLSDKEVSGVSRRSTLGQMVKMLKDRGFLSRNGEYHFDDLVLKRNYLAHSIFDLFAERIEETILQRTDLTVGDTDIFSDRAHQLADELLFFEKIVGDSEDNDGELL